MLRRQCDTALTPSPTFVLGSSHTVTPISPLALVSSLAGSQPSQGAGGHPCRAGDVFLPSALGPLMVDASGVKLHTRHVGLLVLEASGGKQPSLYFLGTEEVTLAGRLSAK